MNNTRLCLLVIAFSSLLLFSCNDDPTSIGSNLVPDDDKISFSEYDTNVENPNQSSSYYKTIKGLGTAEKILVGKNSYSESVAMLQYKFYLSDSLNTLLKNNQIKVNKATLSMPITYSLGNKSLPFDFTVHNIKSSWSPVGFNVDSLSSLSYDSPDISSSRTYNDTLVTLELHTETVKSWLKAEADTQGTQPNRGMIFKPSAATQRFIGFNAVKLYDDSKLPTLIVEIEQPGGFLDTLSATPYTDIHAVTGTSPILQNNIVLQGGLVSQGSLFFDLSSLPKDIIINNASLILTVDQANTLDGEPKSDSIWVQVYKDSTEKTFTADSSVITILELQDDGKFIGDISWMVQKWLSDSTTHNHGVKLSLYDESVTAARISLYGSKAQDQALRPRLKIVYLFKSKQ